MESVTRRKYLLPAIQREFIWDEEQIVNLFDSLMKDYPIGTFLFWSLERDGLHRYSNLNLELSSKSGYPILRVM